MYGTNLRLPGGYFTPQEDFHTDPIPFMSDLKKHMRSLHAIPPRHTTRPHVHVSDSLSTTTNVFIRHDAVRKPLQPPDDGPYRVLARNDQYYTLHLNGRQDTVSIDRLKLAYIEQIPPDTLRLRIPLHPPQHTPAMLLLLSSIHLFLRPHNSPLPLTQQPGQRAPDAVYIGLLTCRISCASRTLEGE